MKQARSGMVFSIAIPLRFLVEHEICGKPVSGFSDHASGGGPDGRRFISEWP